MIRYLPERQEERRICSTNLGEAIRQLASLNCSYTEMLELLQEAQRNNQLTSRLAINAVPRINQNRFLPDEFEVAEDGNSEGFFPNLFSSRRESNASATEHANKAEALKPEPESAGAAAEKSEDERLPAPLGSNDDQPLD